MTTRRGFLLGSVTVAAASAIPEFVGSAAPEPRFFVSTFAPPGLYTIAADVKKGTGAWIRLSHSFQMPEDGVVEIPFLAKSGVTEISNLTLYRGTTDWG